MREANSHTTTPPPLTVAATTELLRSAGLGLETNGTGYQIAHGRRILAGCGRKNYEMSMGDVCQFVRRALSR